MWINKKSWKVIQVAEREKNNIFIVERREKKSYKRLLTSANGAELRAIQHWKKLKIKTST